jgi:hypothetical protein
MKIKPAVKLDLGEMCKLRLLFLSAVKYVFRFHLLRIRFFYFCQR